MPPGTRKSSKGGKFSIGGYSLLPSWSRREGEKKQQNEKNSSKINASFSDFHENWLYFFWKPFIFFAYLLTSYFLLVFMWLDYEKKECPLLV